MAPLCAKILVQPSDLAPLPGMPQNDRIRRSSRLQTCAPTTRHFRRQAQRPSPPARSRGRSLLTISRDSASSPSLLGVLSNVQSIAPPKGTPSILSPVSCRRTRAEAACYRVLLLATKTRFARSRVWRAEPLSASQSGGKALSPKRGAGELSSGRDSEKQRAERGRKSAVPAKWRRDDFGVSSRAEEGGGAVAVVGGAW